MISVVIPTLNAGSTLTACLKSIHCQQTAVDRIVVVDAGSQDRTLAIAEQEADIVLTSRANRSLQRNVGWQSTDSPIVLFVDADMVLDPLVVSACERMLLDDPTLVGLVIPEQSFGPTFWARVKAFERSFYQGVWWMEASRCFRREHLIATGGYDPALIGGEDWDLDERMRRRGAIARIRPIIWHNEQNLSLADIRHKKVHYATTLKAYAARQPDRARRQLSVPARLRLLARRPGKLVRHPLLTLGLTVVGATEWWAKKRESPENSLSHERPIP